MVFIEKFKNIHKEISQNHQELIKALDSVDLEILSVTIIQDQTTKVPIDITLFEEITNLASKLYEKDIITGKLLKQYTNYKNTNKEIKDIKRGLSTMKRFLIENTKIIQKDMKKTSLILSEYKERCRSGFLEFLRALEIDLRRTLKPLVPSDVLQEQLNFRPICTDLELLSSMNSVTKDEMASNPCENTTDKLNNHIQLLVNTLEDVAKNLILITQTTYRSYYELVDPRLLYSEPPSPLAAPLPEYFSYDVGNISEENRKNGNIVLSAKSKERLIQKFIAIQRTTGIKSPLTARKFKEKLEGILEKDAKQGDLLQFFKEEGIPVSEREKLVYDIIHSERSGEKDVSLDDIIYSSDRHISESKSKIKKNDVPTKDLNEIREYNTHPDYIDSDDDDDITHSLETFVNDTEKLPRSPSKINLHDKSHEIIPPLNMNKPKNKNNQYKSIQSTEKKGRASTPGKINKEKKNIKRVKTPGLQRKKKAYK